MKRNIKAIAIFMAMVLTLGVLPTGVFAQEFTTEAKVTCPGCEKADADLLWTAWETPAENTVTEDLHYQLTGDVQLTGQITVEGNLLLDLNGFTLKAAEKTRCFTVNGKLTVIDSSAAQTGAIIGGDISANGTDMETAGGGTILVNETGALNIYSGTVKGGYAITGGNIHAAKDSTLTITGGVVRDGYAVAISSSTGRGGNIYSLATTTITGTAKILNGYAQYGNLTGTNNSGRGGNLFIHSRSQTTISGNAIIAGGYAGHRGGNILVNYYSVLTVQENAQIYGGTARKYANNVDVMTATLNMEGGTIYGSPAGGAKSNIQVYSTSSVFNFTGGKIYGRVEALAGMTINISGKPYVEHLFLPCELNADGTEKARAIINPGTFEEGAWVGLEVQAEDQTFTGPLEDFSSYMYFFHYDKQGLTWYHRKTDNSLYLTKGTPCQCCGEDVNDIIWVELATLRQEETPTLTAGHYKLTENEDLSAWTNSTITVDGTAGYVTLAVNSFNLTGAEGADIFNILPGSIFNIVETATKQTEGVTEQLGTIKGVGTQALRILGQGTQVNLYGGILTGHAVGDNNFGGTVYLTDYATFNLYGGALDSGTSEDHGGNLFGSAGAQVNIYGGTITGGTITGGVTETGESFSGNGGNIYITGRDSVLKIYGGTITEGKNLIGSAGNIMLNSGATGYMYDGLVENGGAKKYGANIYVSGDAGSGANKQYTQFFMYGGTFGAVDTSVANVKGISRASANNPLLIYNGTINSDQEPSNFIGDCACYFYDGTRTEVWNYGHNEKTCDISCPAEEAWGKCYVKTMNTGYHDYVIGATGSCSCSICGYTFYQENMAAVVGGRIYDSLQTALKRAEEGAVITLLDSLEETKVEVANGMILDLNGNTLTTGSFTSVGGHIVDSTGGEGALVADSVSLAAQNMHLPMETEEGLRFSSITPDHYLERLSQDVVRVRFTFRERSYDTIIDDLVKSGSRDITVELKLTWTDSKGETQAMTYICDHALLVKYAEKWNSRRYVATISGVSDVKDLTCTVQVSSAAASGVTVAAATLNNVNYINKPLSWDSINSYVLKSKTMSVSDMRDAIVDFMVFNKTYLWTPDETVNYIKNAGGTADVMNQGTVYGGLPYVGVATGNPYRMMDYINPETGLLDMEKAIPALKNNDSVTMADLKYFGSQCSISVYWAWGRFINSPDYRWTASAVPNNDFIFLGNVKTPQDLTSWSLAYNTKACCADNGEQTLYEGYAQLKKADGMVYWTTAGHVVMVYADPVVVRKADGTIDGEKSYIRIIDQGQSWKTGTNDAGDTFRYKSDIDLKYTFKKLFEISYVPFTFKEFIGQASVEDTTVQLVKDEVQLISGTILESDRSYVTTQTVDTISWSDLFSSRIRSNYGIADVYVTLYNSDGEEFYRHAVRTGTAGNKNLAMEESGDMVTIWQYATVTKNRTYNGKIEVQLATGERVTIFSGNITT